MWINRLSIKSKLLILLVTLPIVTLTLYILLAIRVFTNDKLAYVFDSSASVSRTLAAQVKSETDGLVSLLKPFWQNYDSQIRQFGPQARAIFDANPDTFYIAIYSLIDGEPSREQDLARANIEQTPKLDKEFQHIIKRAEKSGIAISLYGDTNELASFALKINDKQQTKAFYIVAIQRASELIRTFGKKSVTNPFLIDSNGDVLIGPTSPIFKITNFSGWGFFKSLQDPKTPQGVTEDRMPNSETELLVSFSHVGTGDLSVVTLVEKVAALQAIHSLIWKSLLFFLSLVSGSVIISVLASGRLTKTIRDLYTATKTVSEGNFKINVQVDSKDEVGSLAESFNHMAQEVSRLMATSIEKARMEKELETARTVQETLFPAINLEHGKVQVAGLYEPASECGGDWWHYCQMRNQTYIWIGDATGHGAAAALVTSAAKATASVLEYLGTMSSAMTPALAMDFLNRAISEMSRGRMMMTFFLACVDNVTGEMTYSNASHDPPYVLRFGPEDIRKENLILLNDINNPRLGEAASTKFKQAKLQLMPGDSVLFYTDGIADVTNESGKAWGERNLIKSALHVANSKLSPSDAIHFINQEVTHFRQGAHLKDDITVVLCQYQQSA